jgi:hypothetical protein
VKFNPNEAPDDLFLSLFEENNDNQEIENQNKQNKQIKEERIDLAFEDEEKLFEINSNDQKETIINKINNKEKEIDLSDELEMNFEQIMNGQKQKKLKKTKPDSDFRENSNVDGNEDEEFQRFLEEDSIFLF